MANNNRRGSQAARASKLVADSTPPKLSDIPENSADDESNSLDSSNGDIQESNTNDSNVDLTKSTDEGNTEVTNTAASNAITGQNDSESTTISSSENNQLPTESDPTNKDKPADTSDQTDVQTPSVLESENMSNASADPAIEPVADTAPLSAEAQEEVSAEQVAADNQTAEDNLRVSQLKGLLEEFVEANRQLHSNPEDFTDAARLLVIITNFIIRSPKPEIMDTFLEFITDNPHGVCEPANFMKGSTLLSKGDEQRVGYIYNLFRDIATSSRVALNTNLVTQVLKKPEFMNYYNRKMRATSGQ